jgi:glycosyltransferase involved in cell wall biosynthesis
VVRKLKAETRQDTLQKPAVSSFLPINRQPVTPRVSIIIPTYNRSSIVPRAIESVLQQTWSDYELIVIDDGSTDDTHDRLQDYEGRIQYVYQANRGFSAARNAGVKLANGEWIAFLDSDDLWHPTKLERQFEALASLGGEFGACVTDCRYVGDPKLTWTVFEAGGLRPESEFGPLYDVMKYLLSESTYAIFAQSLLVLRSAFNNAGGLDESLDLYADWELMFRLSFKTKFCYVSAALVDVDRTPSLSRVTDIGPSRADDKYAQDEALCEKMLAHPEFADSQERRVVQGELIRIYYDWAAARAGDFRLRSAWRIMKKLRRQGQDYRTIFGILTSRMGRKLLRTVQPAPAQQ